jgi:hypothetical protein
MIPEARLSSQAVIAPFSVGDDLSATRTQDYERGGVALGDPTQGLNVATWELRVTGRDVRIRKLPSGQFSTLFSQPGITDVRLAFDQNMSPVVAYNINGLWRLRWFDPRPAVNAFVITPLPGARDVCVALDDKRPGQRDFSDVLIFYLKDPPAQQPQHLYMRAQRDRYGVEYTLGSLRPGTTALYKAGMAVNGRMRFATFGLYAPVPEPRREVPPYPPGVQVDAGVVLDFRRASRQYVGSTGYAVLPFQFELYKAPTSERLP